MSDVAIRAENLGKRFRVQPAEIAQYRTLRDVLASAAKATFGRREPKRGTRPTSDFWALKDVSFEVKTGEVVGLIGRNGAGKSTLLKILSRITEPTEGYADLHGRVGSLLEVGTGFHPELTGRENIFLNGAILGMRREEIRRKFDEIVAFAEIDRFLDSPVKFYSSGMFVRLAFAVAAHLEPEILFVDEVLAVGDASFQKKCLGKMDDVARAGRTVVLVSHNMGAITQLCSHAILLEAGRLVFAGEIGPAVEQYGCLLNNNKGVHNFQDTSGRFALLAVTVTSSDGQARTNFDIHEEIIISITYRLREKFDGMDLAFTLSRNFIDIFNTHDTDKMRDLPSRGPGAYTSTVRIPGSFLKAGHYNVRLATGVPMELLGDYEGLISFDVEELSEDTKVRGYRQARPGHIIAPVDWELKKID